MITHEEYEANKAIIEGAPEGVTHVSNYYLRRSDKNDWDKYQYYWYCPDHKKWVLMDSDVGLGGNIRSLDDLQEIQHLRAENDAFKKALLKISGMSSMSYHSLESAKIVASNALKNQAAKGGKL